MSFKVQLLFSIPTIVQTIRDSSGSIWMIIWSNLDDSKSILSFLLQGKFSDLWVGFCKGKTSEICRRFLTGQRDSPMFQTQNLTCICNGCHVYTCLYRLIQHCNSNHIHAKREAIWMIIWSNLDDSKSILSFLLQGKFSDLWVGFCKGKTSEICRRFLTGQRDSPMFQTQNLTCICNGCSTELHCNSNHLSLYITAISLPRSTKSSQQFQSFVTASKHCKQSLLFSLQSTANLNQSSLGL